MTEKDVKQVAKACEQEAKDNGKAQVTVVADEQSGYFALTLAKDSVYKQTGTEKGFLLEATAETDDEWKETVARVCNDMNRFKALLEMLTKMEDTVQNLYDALKENFGEHIQYIEPTKDGNSGDEIIPKIEKPNIKYDN